MSHGLRGTRAVSGLLVGVLTAALLLGLAAPAAQAQSFQDAMSGALDFQCRGLAGSPSGSGDYQSSLFTICNNIPSVSGTSSGGSIAILGSSLDGSEQRRILRRLEEKREEAREGGVRAASADSGQIGPFGFFVTSEFEWINKSASPNEAGFDSNSKGGIVGFDYGITKMVTVGLAIHYSRVDGEFDGEGGKFHTDNMGVTIYGSASPFPNFFIDGAMGYVRREYEVNRRATYVSPGNGTVVDGFTHSDTTGDEFNMSLNAGYDVVMKALTFGPRLGVDYSTIDIGGFQEVGQKNRPEFDTGLELAYKRQHRESLTTKLGIFASYALSVGFGVLIPQFTAEWVHEFLNDQRTVFFKFREDNAGAQLRFQTDEPDRDYFRVGTGVVLVLPKNISAFVNYRVLLGYNDRIAHTLNAGLRVGF